MLQAGTASEPWPQRGRRGEPAHQGTAEFRICSLTPQGLQSAPRPTFHLRQASCPWRRSSLQSAVDGPWRSPAEMSRCRWCVYGRRCSPRTPSFLMARGEDKRCPPPWPSVTLRSEGAAERRSWQHQRQASFLAACLTESLAKISKPNSRSMKKKSALAPPTQRDRCRVSEE